MLYPEWDKTIYLPLKVTFFLGARWSRGRALSWLPDGPGSKAAYSSIFFPQTKSPNSKRDKNAEA